MRAIGTELGLPDEIVWRQPFPGPGLGIRIIGEITKERLDLLREADAIAREELSKAGLDRDIWQCPVVLLADVHSVGVQGDERTYGSPIVLRPVSSEDAMTADWSRIRTTCSPPSRRVLPTNAVRSTAWCLTALPSRRQPSNGSESAGLTHSGRGFPQTILVESPFRYVTETSPLSSDGPNVPRRHFCISVKQACHSTDPRNSVGFSPSWRRSSLGCL